MSNKDFSFDSDMFSISQKFNPTEVLEFIQKYPKGVSMYDISKEMKINRNTLYYFLRNLEFSGVIKSKLKINENNRRVRLIFYNKKNNGDPNGKN